MNKILELKQVAVNYGNIKALKKIDLEVIEGEIVSLIGANGAGKSTLLKSIVGLVPLVNGEIRFRGELVANVHSGGLSTDRIIARGVGMAPEGRGVFADMTVKENLEMGAFLKNNKLFVSRKLEEMFAMFSILKDRRKQKAGSLSGGEQQMLAIARALMSEPQLLLLDEPALGLAPLIIRDIFDTIVKINREDGVTVFLVEQNAKMALRISSRGFVMETGNIVLEDESKHLLENPKVKAAYLGEG